MEDTKKFNTSLIFLGIADHINTSGGTFPIGETDIYRLSQVKEHVIYPAAISKAEWIFLIKPEFFGEFLGNLKIRIVCSDDPELYQEVTLERAPKVSLDSQDEKGTLIKVVKSSVNLSPNYVTISVSFEATINYPAVYKVVSEYNNVVEEIGQVEFIYCKSDELSLDQINAIKSNPDAPNLVGIELGCKTCDAKLRTYVSLERNRKKEREGYIWYRDNKDQFICGCGKLQYNLKYIKESMHGLLVTLPSKSVSCLSYERRYSHKVLTKSALDFLELIEITKDEKTIQSHIENHLVLLSHFRPKRIFIRPKLLNKHIADFAVVDYRSQLIFIELERPSMKLFKKDGHMTADFMHAYGQVVDWLDLFSKNRAQILKDLEIDATSILKVSGAVIAGRRSDVSREHLIRHMESPPYQNVEFITIDDLGTSLISTSEKLS